VTSGPAHTLRGPRSTPTSLSPAGIVTHPAIDAAIQLRGENRLKPGGHPTRPIELIANPLVLSLTGKTEPRTGLEGKFSIYHCIAVGLIYGAGWASVSSRTRWCAIPAVVTLRRKVTVHPDPKVGRGRNAL